MIIFCTPPNVSLIIFLTLCWIKKEVFLSFILLERKEERKTSLCTESGVWRRHVGCFSCACVISCHVTIENIWKAGQSKGKYEAPIRKLRLVSVRGLSHIWFFILIFFLIFYIFFFFSCSFSETFFYFFFQTEPHPYSTPFSQQISSLHI